MSKQEIKNKRLAYFLMAFYTLFNVGMITFGFMLGSDRFWPAYTAPFVINTVFIGRTIKQLLNGEANAFAPNPKTGPLCD